ncbi:MAG: amino acid adenylation domain-containing protein [Jatrophihabitantaceae bacterium]
MRTGVAQASAGRPTGPVGRPSGLPAPLSLAQERLWFVDQQEGEQVHHNDGIRLDLTGPLRVDLLERAVAAIVDRHEILRTAFIDTDAGVRQHTCEHPVELPVVDVTGLTDDDFDRLCQADLERELQLSAGRPLQMRLYHRSPQRHVLVALIHHLVCDLWSLAIFTEELSEFYNAFGAGRQPDTAPLALQYVDFAEWERSPASQRQLAKDQQYWLRKLAGAPPLLSFTAARPRSASQGFSGGNLRVPIAPELADELRNWSRSRGVTTFMTMVAVFNLLVADETRSSDIVVATPVATRGFSALEPLIGCFLNLLVLRTDVSGVASFEELVLRQRSVCLDAYAHQEIPFQHLVRELAPRRERSHQPIAQVAFALQSAPTSVLELDNLQASWQQLETGRSRLDLTVRVIEDGPGYQVEVEFDHGLFDEAWAHRFGTRFVALARAAVAGADRAPAELLSEVNGAVGTGRSELTGPVAELSPSVITECFERAARQNLTGTAVASDADTISYAELDARSNQLARRLRELGVSAEVPVAVLLPRSIAEVIAIVAVLKAGGIYVPLNPRDPADRHQTVLTAAAPTVVITGGGTSAPAGATVVLDVERDAAAIDALPGTGLATVLRPDNAAYLLFTSGSTGAPKGVLVSHASFSNRMAWAQSAHPLDARDRVLRKAVCTFDVSMDELFRALMHGATSVLLPDASGFDPRQLSRTIEQQSVTDVDFAPTALRELLRDPADARRCHSLRHIVSGVEALSADLVRQVHEHLQVSLWNLYGPTEASVSCLARPCPPGEVADQVPLGRPMTNTYLRLLDEDLNPVPQGQIGEICIGGAGLARGYVGSPDLTAERFVPDPFGTAGTRLYRTGDLGRINADGEVLFDGRADLQLNLHGYRIEPAEVERRLLEIDGVDMAAVGAPTDAAGFAQLTAFIVPTPGHGFDQKAIVRRLRSVLPGYLVPAVYQVVSEIPVNAQGKRDLNAVPTAPEADLAVPGVGVSSDPEATETEVVEGTAGLLRIWREVLSQADLGVDDDFFDAGGDSLIATRIAARIRRELGSDVDVVDVLDYPTVTELSTQLGL